MRHFLVSGTLLVSGIAAQEYSNEVVQAPEYPDGNHWTAWSMWYGCAETTRFGAVTRSDIATKQEFCSYPGRTQTYSIRYRECVLQDNIRYPDKINDPSAQESRYADALTGAEYEDVQFGEFIPTAGFPNSAPEYTWTFSNGNLGVANTANTAESCVFNGKVRERCQSASTNLRCDPRFQLYADRYNENPANENITVDDVWAQRIIHNNEAVIEAIPEPFLTYQVQEALCPQNCPVPLPWTSWNCHCDQGSEASRNDVDSITLDDDDRNPDNLPQCDCGKFKRRRYQLCNDDDTTDDVTCASVGKMLTELYPDRCLINAENEAARDWYRPWYYTVFDDAEMSPYWFNDETDAGNDVTPNWFSMSHWTSSRNQDTPWRHFETKSIVVPDSEDLDEETEEPLEEALVNFLSEQNEKHLSVDEFGNVMDEGDPETDLGSSLDFTFREMVVARWVSMFDWENEHAEFIAANVFNNFYNTYPKYNLETGLANGCNFMGADGTFAGFFDSVDFEDVEGATFANFEESFQQCVFQSYFMDYELYRSEHYPSLVRVDADCDALDCEETVVFDMDDFPEMAKMLSELMATFDFDCEEDSENPFNATNINALWGFSDTNCTTVYNLGSRITDLLFFDSGVFRYDFTEVFEDDNDSWRNATTLPELIAFKARQMQSRFALAINTAIGELADEAWYDFGDDFEYGIDVDVWYAAMNTVSNRRDFTNNLINLMLNPSEQHFNIDMNEFLRALEQKDIIVDLTGEPSCENVEDCDDSPCDCNDPVNRERDGCCRRWMRNNIDGHYEQYGLYNMTAIMWAEQYHIRPEHVDEEQDRLDGWTRYQIEPEHNYDLFESENIWWENTRPQNKMEYNYNEERQRLLFEVTRDNPVTGVFGDCPGGLDEDGERENADGCRAGYNTRNFNSVANEYELIRLTGAGAYNDACWSGSGLGEVVKPFGYEYYSNFEQYEGRYELLGNDRVLRIYYEDLTMRASMIRFIRNRFTSIEVGFQEEECTSDTGELAEWGTWGACDVDCGVGNQWRYKNCEVPDGRILVNENQESEPNDHLNVNITASWVPEDMAEWTEYSAVCQCEGAWWDSRECFTGCEYGDWSDWRHDGTSNDGNSGNTCFFNSAKWDWVDQGMEGPPSCVPQGLPNNGTRYRTRGLECGDEERCCDMEHAETCHIPYCSGWKEWGSWSEWSVSCGEGREGHRMRTRDCLGMDTDVGDTPACPCHATFAITECPWNGAGGDDDDSCRGHYNQDASWNTDDAHDEEDPGYLQIEHYIASACPYLRRACQEDRDELPENQDSCDDADINALYWSDWSVCSTTCGAGIQRRHRECLPWAADWVNEYDANSLLGHVPGCRDGIVREIQNCVNQPACPIIRQWAEWSECSQSCGDDGMQERIRECAVHNAEDDVMEVVDCPEGVNVFEERQCRRMECPMLSDWTVATECTAECRERNGYTKMVRSCMYGDESDLGCDCVRNEHNIITCEDGEGLVRYERCNTDILCPFWGTWNTWSVCEELDGVSGHRRTRSCINPQNPEDNSEVMGAPECQEYDRYEIVPCYDTECPVV